jgi:hypothetical protein
MEFVQKTLACSYCGKTIQSPVTLPCGTTICKHHVNQENEFDCLTCNKIHAIPKEGFQINEMIDSILKSNLNNLHFGNEYQRAVDVMRNLDELIKSYRLLKRDPNFEIDKVIGDLKGNIDLKLEKLRLAIDKEAEELIQHVDDYYNECKNKAKELDFKKMDRTVAMIESEVEKSKGALNLFLIDRPKWKAITASLETRFHLLNDDFISIRTELFLNKLDKYNGENQLERFANSNLRLNFNYAVYIQWWFRSFDFPEIRPKKRFSHVSIFKIFSTDFGEKKTFLTNFFFFKKQKIRTFSD